MKTVNRPAVGEIDYPPSGFPEVICAIGDDVFGSQLLTFLSGTCGAEHCSIFHMGHSAVSKVAAVSIDGTDMAQRQVALYLKDQRWRRDAMMIESRQQLTEKRCAIVHGAISDMADVDFREVVYGPSNICDRLLLCERSEDGMIGLSLLRSRTFGAFSDNDVLRLTEVMVLLLSTINKHVSISLRNHQFACALTSLEQIESSMAAADVAFPRREAEVCARIIYGVCSIGIALDLGISEETVVTYRKRVYQRLGIASQRELLVWYLGLWNRRSKLAMV